MIRNHVWHLLFTGAIAAYFANTATATLIPGPDAFGYKAKTISFNLRDVSATGNDIGIDTADDKTAVVPIGFTFPFYGVNYSQVEVSDNGVMSFTPTGNAGCCSGRPIPTVGNPIDNFIAGYWEDLNPIRGGKIRAQTLGAVGSREFIVGYYQVRDFDDPSHSINTFEMILHEGSGDIELQLAQIQYDAVDNKVIGIENANGTIGLQVTYVPNHSPGLTNGDLLFHNQAYLISRPVPEPTTLGLVLALVASTAGMRVLGRHVRW